ncbi:MAG: hypothetical protein IT462_07330 [Planctomycetes bacterium]|nr:hypothetical protein [Planctomycetota bacterium]
MSISGGQDFNWLAYYPDCELFVSRTTTGKEEVSGFFFQLDASGVIEADAFLDSADVLDAGGALKPATWHTSLLASESLEFTPTLTSGELDLGELRFSCKALLGEDAFLAIGQVVHTSGIPAAWHDGFELVIGENPGPVYAISLTLDAQGRFGAEVGEWTQRGDLKPEDMPWRVGFHEYDSARISSKLSPKFTGCIVDLGRIVLDCAVLQATLSGQLDDDVRRQRAGLKDVPPVSFDLNMLGYEDWQSTVRFTDGRVTIFLPPGPYDYEVWDDDPYAFYAPLEGSLEFKAGQVETLELRLTPLPIMLVKMKAGDGTGLAKTNPAFEVRWRDAAGKSLGKESQWNWEAPARPVAVEKTAATCCIKAWADGWQAVEVEQAVDKLHVDIVLTTRKEEEFGTVRVKVPELPAGMKFGEDVLLRSSRGPRPIPSDATCYIGFDEASRVATFRLAVGEWAIVLEESGLFWGYKDGLLCTPHRVKVETGKTVEIELTLVGPPPWEVPSAGYVASFTCEGQFFSYRGPCVDGTFFEGNFGREFWVAQSRPVDFNLLDGDSSVLLKPTLPGKDSDKSWYDKAYATYRHEFPCRLEVRLTRQGKPSTVEKFSLWVTSSDPVCQARCDVDYGKAGRLWLPPGEYSLTTSKQGFVDTRQVSIRPNEKTVVEVDIATSVLCLAWESGEGEEISPTDWLLCDASGQVKSAVSYDTPYLELDPGRYVLRPAFGDAGAPQIEVDFKGHNEVVTLPFVPCVSWEGELLIAYPTDLKLSRRGYYVNLVWFCPHLGDQESAINTADQLGQNGTNWTLTHEGICLWQLPINVEVVVLGFISEYKPDDGEPDLSRGWAMRPRRIKVTAERQSLDAGVWERAVALSEEWEQVGGGFDLVPVDNPWRIHYGVDSRSFVPAGDYIFKWKSPDEEKQPSFELRISLRPAASVCGLPTDLRQRLLALEAFDGPDPPPEGR